MDFVLRMLPLCLCLLLVAATAGAKVHQVVLYPDGGQITEHLDLALSAGAGGVAQGVFELPSQADPQSLVVAMTGRQVQDLSWETVERPESPRVKDIRAKLDAALTTRDTAAALAASLAARLDFWKRVQLGDKSGADSISLAETLGKNVQELAAKLPPAQRDLADKDTKVKELEAQLQEARGATGNGWKVTVRFSGQPQGQGQATVEYALADCGWLPVYRLEAHPKDKKVDMGFEAELWQSSGQEWQATILLATTRAANLVEPPFLPPWVIQPRQPRPAPAPMARTGGVMAMKAESYSGDAAMMAAAEVEHRATYAVWNLGERRLAPGDKQRLAIKAQSLPATFTWLLRPSQGEEAFLRAEVKLPEAADMPAGEALYVVDGAMVGKGGFDFQGSEKTIFFGSDPQVRAKFKTLAKQSGEKGLLGGKQTYLWKWAAEVQSDKGFAVPVRMEAAKPQPRDQRIELTPMADPAPSEDKDNVLVWNFELPAKGKKTVVWGADMKAPADLQLDLGR